MHLSPSKKDGVVLLCSFKNCFAVEDIGAFFGILGDVFSKIAVIIGVLLLNEQMPKELVLGRILPGIAVGSMLGSILYFRETYRLGIKELCFVISITCIALLHFVLEKKKSTSYAKSTTPTQASGYVVLIRWLQSASIPFVTTQSVGVLNPPHE